MAHELAGKKAPITSNQHPRFISSIIYKPDVENLQKANSNSSTEGLVKISLIKPTS
jgi:hypothetical protein